MHRLLLLACRVRGTDPERLLDRVTRSGSATQARVRRHRPSAALLATMARRLGPDDPSVRRVRARTARGESLRSGLPDRLPQPGGRIERTHWLFPVRADDPAALVARLRQAGVDASAATSNLVALTRDGPAADLMRHVVYVPTYPELPAGMHEAVRAVLSRDPS